MSSSKRKKSISVAHLEFMMGAILIRNYVLNFVQGSNDPFLGFFCRKKTKKIFGKRGYHL